MTGGSVMLGKHYNLFWFPDCSNDKNERSGPFAWLAFVFLHPLTLYREAFCLFYMHELMSLLLTYYCYLMKFYCVLFRKVVSWLCWNRFYSSCDYYSTRRGKLEWSLTDDYSFQKWLCCSLRWFVYYCSVGPVSLVPRVMLVCMWCRLLSYCYFWVYPVCISDQFSVVIMVIL